MSSTRSTSCRPSSAILQHPLDLSHLDRAYGEGIALSFDDAFDSVLGRVQSPGLL
jgi:hypothetical protein